MVTDMRTNVFKRRPLWDQRTKLKQLGPTASVTVTNVVKFTVNNGSCCLYKKLQTSGKHFEKNVTVIEDHFRAVKLQLQLLSLKMSDTPFAQKRTQRCNLGLNGSKRLQHYLQHHQRLYSPTWALASAN
jgi:hypothetical protein